MRDTPVFIEVAELRAKNSGRDVSLSALEIHVRVVAHTVRTDCPTFIEDLALDAIAPGPVTTMAAIELCLNGFWRRIDGGYVITDDKFLRHMAHSSWTRKIATACRRIWAALNRETFIPL